VATVEPEPKLARYQLYVPRDLYALRGHFRGVPIVPGVVELELARAKAVERWPELGSLRRALRVKFLRPLRPGERLALTLERRSEHRVEFCFAAEHDDDRADTIATGSLTFADPKPG
jgi:3-hydroxymyristoyl/3-hydroxydecanoyl-(acyl carrier protein) dehydratase